MQLGAWLRLSGISVREFARRIGTHWTSVYNYLDDRLPRPDILLRIEDETDGAVTSEDFYQARRRKSQEGM